MRSYLDSYLYTILPTGAARYASTLLHLQPFQILHRNLSALRRSLIMAQTTRAHHALLAQANALRLVPPERSSPDTKRWRELANWRVRKPPDDYASPGGVFRLAGEELNLGAFPPWNLYGHEPADRALKLFHLHYFDWQWKLLADGEQKLLARLIVDWIHGNPLGCEHSFEGPWSPYTISLRLPNWFAVHRMLRPFWKSSERQMVEMSLAAQALYLSRHLEWEHRGNHLLENIKALLMAGYFFEGPKADKWRRRATRLLYSQLHEQVLPGGMHFERSPMYSAIVLDRLLDILTVTPPDWPVRAFVERTAAKMLRALEFLLAPDGTIPLLGDSVQGMAPPFAALRQRVKTRPTLKSGAHAPPPGAECDGHFIIRHDIGKNANWLLFDAAPAGPAYCGAHQHADLFGWELWLGGAPIVCDGGGGCYEEGPERDELRSPISHATVLVDSDGPGDPWKSFRMARPANPARVHLRRLPAGGWLLEGTHDGFRHRSVRQRRTLKFFPREGTLLVEDTFFPVTWNSRADRLHKVAVSIPLHESLTVLRTGENSAILQLCGSQRPVARLEFSTSGGGPPAWHTLIVPRRPRFGQKILRTVILIETTTRGSAAIHCSISSILAKEGLVR